MKLINRIFNLFKSLDEKTVRSELPVPQEHKENKDLMHFLNFYLNQSPYIKIEKRQVVLEHLLNIRDIFKTNNYLSLAEKKELGVNVRVKVSRELADVLNSDGLKLNNPKYAILSIEHKAGGDYNRYAFIQEFKTSKVLSKVKIICPIDAKTCEWCKSINEKSLSVDTNINLLIQDNCTCEDWNRCVIVADI